MNHCISGINPTWSPCMILLMYWWILFASILPRIFASMLISVTELQFSFFVWYICAIMVAQMVKNLPAMWETRVQPLGWQDPLEKRIATQSSLLAWRNPWTEKPCGLQSMGLQRVGHDWVTNTHVIMISGTWCPLRMRLGGFLPMKFLEEFEKNYVSSSLNVW